MFNRCHMRWPKKYLITRWLRLYSCSPCVCLYVLQPWYCCSVAKSCPTLCDRMGCSTPGFPVLHHFTEFAQIHVHWVGDAIKPSHPLSPFSPPALNLSGKGSFQGLFQWVTSSYMVAKVLELQLQHHSFQWVFRVDFLQAWLYWSPCSPRVSQESFLAIWKHQFFSTWSSLWSNSHIHTWILEKL